MTYAYVRRGCVFLLFIAMAVFFSQNNLLAEDPVLSRTGAIRITKPDGTVLRVEKDQVLPTIPSGSTVEVLSGSIDIGPSEGFIQVVVAGSVATVEAGERLITRMSETKMADFELLAGQINIITGNTTVTVNAGQEVQLSLNKTTGVVEVKSIKGTIQTLTAGIKAAVPQEATAKIGADAKTRKVHVESISGSVTVTSIEGEVIILAMAESMDTEASVVGEIQTFAEEAMALYVPTEEPAEPERPEGSPFRP